MEINEILQGNNDVLLIVRRDDLIAFATSYANHLKAGIIRPLEKEEEKPISQPEAIKFLGKSRQTLIKWRKKGLIIGYRLGGRIYYMKSELIEALYREK
jgi:hypothetical protein